MELKYKKINHKPDRSFNARRETIPCLEDNWHFHEEYELIYFMKSNGIRYVGNTVSNFEQGEIYLIGSNLPHLFKNKREYYGSELTESAVDMIIVQFYGDFMGERFNKLPESQNFKKLLESSTNGLMYSQSTSTLLHNQLTGLVDNTGFSGLVNLLSILSTLSISPSTTICSQGIVNTFRKREKERMANVINYMTENYDRRIDLEEIAKVAHMAPNAFCRFFKKRTQKSFSEYLTEIRIGNACKLLIEGKMQISEVSYLSGFNSLSNFNRKFKFVMGVTPSQYLRKFLSNSAELV